MLPSSSGRAPWSSALCCALLGAGCADTGAAAGAALPLCVAADPVPERPRAVVMVRADLRQAGVIVCSGFAIAPTLVVTTSLCTSLPPGLDLLDLDDPDQRLAGGAFNTYVGEVDYDDQCRVAGGDWSPIERGEFAALLGEPLGPEALVVALPPGRDEAQTSTVNRIFRSHADSRCWDTLAVLVLDRDLGLPAVTLELEDQSRVGDPVLLSGIGIVDDDYGQHDLASRIERLTFETGDELTPPRSLLVPGSRCDFETGGPVHSEATGAVIGTIAYHTGDCDDPQAFTIATRIAPFRRMLLDAARAASEVLRVEPLAAGRTKPPACR